MILSRKAGDLSLIFAATALAIVACVASGTASAAPTISSVSGTPSKGQVLTIRGSGFGTKSPVKPLWYFPFGDGTRGTHPTLSRNQSTSAINGVLGQRSEAAPGSPYVLYYDYQAGAVAMGPDTLSLNSSDVAYAFWKSKFNMPKRGGPDVFNYKLVRIFAQGYKQNVYSGENVMIPEYTAVNNYTNCAECADYSLSGQEWQEDKWLTDEVVYRTSGIDASDGQVWYFRNGFKTNKRTYRLRTSEMPQKYTGITFSHFYRGLQSGDLGFMDIVYVDDTWARVVVSDKPTMSDSQNSAREIQIPVAWADNEIQVSFRAGALPTSSPMYLYIYSADGQRNLSGYPINCSNCTLPNPPSDVTAR